uniref:Uncharacterized protein n=1 Tax=Anguilla anguilla TaxID=7936 RepID=A0A0E9XU68_ANGAN
MHLTEYIYIYPLIRGGPDGTEALDSKGNYRTSLPNGHCCCHRLVVLGTTSGVHVKVS